jgi:hypothetical protein
MLSRIVIIVLVLFVAWRVLTSLGKRASATGHGADSYSRFSPRSRRRRMDQRPGGRDPALEELLPCAGCGTFVPVDRALRGTDDLLYCSEACRRLGAGGDSGEG